MTSVRMKPQSGGSEDPERIVPGGPEWERSYPDHIQRYAFAARELRVGARVLDAGCGCGYGAGYLAERGAGFVVGVDISEEALEHARRHFARANIVWLRDDCHTLEVAAQHAPFDLVCCLENIEHLAKPEKFLERVSDVLGHGAALVVSTPNRILVNKIRGAPSNAPPRNPYHHREYTEGEFRALLGQHFGEVKLSYQCHGMWTRARLALEPALQAVWTNPVMRLGRWMQRRLRGRNVPDSLEALLPSQLDWVILENNPGEDVTWAFLAVCRGQRGKT